MSTEPNTCETWSTRPEALDINHIHAGSGSPRERNCPSDVHSHAAKAGLIGPRRSFSLFPEQNTEHTSRCLKYLKYLFPSVNLTRKAEKDKVLVNNWDVIAGVSLQQHPNPGPPPQTLAH
ncbi:hypothetical protein SDJN02_24646, partial [Cucurbita argyrosperma subsp. argyrosperma]